MDPSSPSAAVFPSKVDWWIVWLMAVPLGVSVMAVISALLAGPPLPAALIVLGVEALVLALIAWTFKTTRYLVTDRELIVRSGPFRWRIEIDGIESIRPSRNPLSSPALSLDRLAVRYGRVRWLLISPQDREGFLEAVVARSRDLVREGDGIRRAF